jgi:hypothetical protein
MNVLIFDQSAASCAFWRMPGDGKSVFCEEFPTTSLMAQQLQTVSASVVPKANKQN